MRLTASRDAATKKLEGRHSGLDFCAVTRNAANLNMRTLGCIRNASLRSPGRCLLAQRHCFSAASIRIVSSSAAPLAAYTARPFSSSTDHDAAEVERTVRDAKQRFRDTLPKGYLTDEEYALYERLYGPPLRETEPEDVGIHTHADMGSVKPENEGTIVKPGEDGSFEEVSYEMHRTLEEAAESHGTDVLHRQVVESAPGYVDVVARSQREHDAMQRLFQDFQAAQEQQVKEEQTAKDDAAAAKASELEENDDADDIFDEAYEDEEGTDDYREGEHGEDARFHPLTLQGRFHKPGPIVMTLPQSRLVQPIEDLLKRTNKKHLKNAAESAYGGPGLPTSPATMSAARRENNMMGVGLAADQRHMTEIEADAFLGAHMPPTYVSTLSVLREVRRRVGKDWIQDKLKKQPEAGLSVLDAGGAGAGLLAWEQIVEAEWSLLKEKGQVTGPMPPGKKTVITGSDRLRHRVKDFFGNTTFLPRLPDYEHTAATRGPRLDGSKGPQQHKTYDLIIASHLFLKETEAHHRQAVLNNLWSLLKPDGGVLIIIEKAHPRGFEAVAHIRDTLLTRYLLPQSGEKPTIDFNPAFQRELEPGRVLAPCTNQLTCPMYPEPGKSKGRKDVCKFSQRFIEPDFHAQLLGKKSNRQGEVEFSYLAMQRGVMRQSAASPREAAEAAFQGYEDHTDADGVDMQDLPRMLMPALKRKGHITMDMCTPEGKLERWTIPKSYGKLAYHDARKSHWGDLWALGAKTRVQRPARTGTIDAETKKRRPHKGDMMMDGMKLDSRERKAKHKDKKMNLIKELIDAEKLHEQELAWEVDRDIAEELEMEVQQERARNTPGGER